MPSMIRHLQQTQDISAASADPLFAAVGRSCYGSATVAMTVTAAVTVALAGVLLAVLVEFTAVGAHSLAVDEVVLKHLHILLRSEDLLHFCKIVLTVGLTLFVHGLAVFAALFATGLDIFFLTGLQSCDLCLLLLGQGNSLKAASLLGTRLVVVFLIVVIGHGGHAAESYGCCESECCDSVKFHFVDLVFEIILSFFVSSKSTLI